MEGQEENTREMISGKAHVTMASTSKSNRPNSRNPEFVPKPKPNQGWQVKRPTRNWLDLPSDVTANVIQRIGVVDILENAQKVCTTWRKICKDLAMWRVIYLDNSSDPCGRLRCQERCKNVVDRSQGQLVDITIIDFCDGELLQYIANRSDHLRRLVIAYSYGDLYGSWTKALMKFSLLEELNIYTTNISKEAIETVGRYCPFLKTLKLNQKAHTLWDGAYDEASLGIRNEIAMTIGQNLHELRHLEIIGDSMTNIGLQAILDGCFHLESLDLRRCLYIDLKGDIGKRCYKQIESLKLPKDSLEGCPFFYENDSEAFDVASEAWLFSDESDEDDYDDFMAYDDDDDDDDDDNGGGDYDDFTDFEDSNEFTAYMAMFE